MAEFEIHHHVRELIKLLGVQANTSESVSSDAYVNLLQENRTPYITTRLSSTGALKKLANQSGDSKAIYKKYDELKIQNVRELDSFVILLSEISKDEKVKALLKKNAQSTSDENSKLQVFESSGISVNGQSSQSEVQKFAENFQRHVASFSISKEMKKRSVPPSIYPFSKWVRERRYMSWDFVLEPRLDNVQVGPIGVLPKETQENLLINDILFCLAGVDGDYINAQKLENSFSERQFKIDDSTDPSLLEMTKRITPLTSHYSTIIRFVEEKSHFEHGLVNHALCAAIREILKDYFILIAQLENQHLQGNLSLQKMWFYLQPTMQKMQAVAVIADVMNKGDCFGGKVLSVLHERTTNLVGDTASEEIHLYLAQCASVPYFEILEKWIYKGIISDPYSEFLVEDNELIKKEDIPVEYSDAYWEKRYTIRREQIPIFLEKVADMILRTGKYLNVVRQCGVDVKFPDASSIKYVVRERHYVEKIEAAYHFASKKLLDVLIDSNDLKGRLRSVKHYFLLDQGDFIVQFMDMAEEELSKDIDSVTPTRLESLLELALQTSVVNSDKYKDDVRVELLPYDLLTQMRKILMIPQKESKDGEVSALTEVPLTGLEAFAFDYDVKWPLSLIINRKALACYQLLFRHLFYCKHVEGQLGKVWTLNKNSKSQPLSVSYSYASAFALLQRMLNFIQNLDYYIMFEVIEPHWETFRRKMLKVLNVDEVLKCHNDFLDDCLSDCMLTFPELFQVLEKLMKICVAFSYFMQETYRYSVNAEFCGMGDSLFPLYEEPETQRDSPAFQCSYQQQISTFQTEFDTVFLELLKMISGLNHNKGSAKMINMLYRLDFNGYYARTQPKALNISELSET